MAVGGLGGPIWGAIGHILFPQLHPLTILGEARAINAGFDGTSHFVKGRRVTVRVDQGFNVLGHQHAAQLDAIPMVGIGDRAGPATIGIDPLLLEGGTDL